MGILIPRLSTAQRTGIAGLGAADEGLTVYDETTNTYWLWDGTQWVEFAMAGGAAWELLGNTGITTSNFLGPINNMDLNFRTNNNERMSLERTGELLIGPGGIINYATAEGDLYVQDVIEVDNIIYLGDRMYHGGDLDTYWDFATDQIYIRAGNVEMIRMIEGGTDYITFNEYGYDVDFRIESDALSHMFFIDASANRMGINTSSPQGQFHFISTGAAGWVTLWDNSSANGGLNRTYNSSASNGSRVIMGITNYSSSSLAASAVIGLSYNSTTSGSGGIGVTGSANNESGKAINGYLSYSGLYSGWAGYFNADVYTAGSYYASDRRLKRDINPIENALDIIDKIEPVSYYFDTEKYPTIGFDEDRLSYGFIAQDLEVILPTLVKEKGLTIYPEGPMTTDMSEETETKLFKLVNYTLMVPILTQAIKEQQVIIEDLEQRIIDMENRLNAMD